MGGAVHEAMSHSRHIRAAWVSDRIMAPLDPSGESYPCEAVDFAVDHQCLMGTLREFTARPWGWEEIRREQSRPPLKPCAEHLIAGGLVRKDIG